MSQKRINEALQMALAATKADPNNRYTTAMIRHARAILSRAATHPDPADVLAGQEVQIAANLRKRQADAVRLTELRKYVMDKLAISNPDYVQKNP